jgi:hypothetical protein
LRRDWMFYGLYNNDIYLDDKHDWNLILGSE